MTNPIQDIAGMVTAKLRKNAVNRDIASRLTNKIAPVSMQSEKNYNTYFSRLKAYLDQDKPQKAIAYSETEQVRANKPPNRSYKK